MNGCWMNHDDMRNSIRAKVSEDGKTVAVGPADLWAEYSRRFAEAIGFAEARFAKFSEIVQEAEDDAHLQSLIDAGEQYWDEVPIAAT